MNNAIQINYGGETPFPIPHQNVQASQEDGKETPYRISVPCRRKDFQEESRG